jgi:hypothetical protein
MQTVEDRLLEIEQQSLLHNLMCHTAESRREEVCPHCPVRTAVTEVPRSVHKCARTAIRVPRL